MLAIQGAGAGMLDSIPTDQVGAFEAFFLDRVKAEFHDLIDEINTKKVLGDDGKKMLKDAISRIVPAFKEKQGL